MKARVKATGNIVDVEWYGHNSMGTIYVDVTHTNKYYEYELDFNTVYDYWTRLEHQYAGMAMQGLVTRGEVLGSSTQAIARDIAEISCEIAHTLVEKYKKEEQL